MIPTTLATWRLAVLACLWAPALGASATDSPPLFGNGAARVTIESCVSRDAIEFRIGDNSVILDDADRDTVHVAMLRRYPALQSHGFAPTHIVLWQQAGGDWLYVTLLAHPAKPHERCFTATFAAAGLSVTANLLKKYFAAAAART